jgi:hypothetical protein
VRGEAVTLRANDEVVVVANSAATAGQVGVAALAGPDTTGGQVVFSWARLWAP